MTLSDTARGQVFQQNGGGFLELLTITHDDLSEPLRFVNNTETITSNGESYIAFPFKVKLPTDKDRAVPRAQLEISNVSRQIGQLIRQLATPPTVQIDIVRMDDFDAVEMTFPPLQLRNARYDNLSVSGDLTVDDTAREPYPQRSFTPAEFPGLF